MLTRRDASAVDDSLVELPALLAIRGLVLKQKDGYKAGKLSASRNWCHIIDADSYSEMRTHNARGQLKTWTLLARFDARHPPAFPWDRLRQCEGKRPPGLICGEDVWGVSCEDLRVVTDRSWPADRRTSGQRPSDLLQLLTSTLLLMPSRRSYWVRLPLVLAAAHYR